MYPRDVSARLILPINRNARVTMGLMCAPLPVRRWLTAPTPAPVVPNKKPVMITAARPVRQDARAVGFPLRTSG